MKMKPKNRPVDRLRMPLAFAFAALALAPLAAQVQVIRSAPYGGLAPLAIAVDGTGRIIVPDLYEGIAYLFDPLLNSLGTIPAPAGPRLYTAVAWDTTENSLWWIDLTGRALHKTTKAGNLLESHSIPADASFAAMTFAPDTGTLFCLDAAADEIVEIARDGTRTAAPAIPLPTGAGSYGLGLAWIPDPGPSGSFEVFCGSSGDGAVRYLARLERAGAESTCLRQEIGALGEFLGGIAWHPAGSDGGGSYYIVEAASREILEVRLTGSRSLCPPGGFACETGNAAVELTWSPGSFDGLEVFRNGSRLAALEGSSAGFEDPSPPLGEELLYQVVGISAGERSAATICKITVPPIALPVLPKTDAFGHEMRWAPDLSFAPLGSEPPALPSGDDGSLQVPIGFMFPFYGSAYESVAVGANGLLAFLGTAGEPANTTIPSTAGPNGIIAPFWDDLEIIGPASVRTELSGSAPERRFAVEWARAQRAPGDASSPTASLSFQAVLHETTGEIDLVWGDLRGPEPGAAHGSSATTGIESPDGKDGILFSFREIAIPERSAVRILPRGSFLSTFLRGDSNGDGAFDISDPISLLLHLFQAGGALRCREAGDSNDDNALDISDATYSLSYLFLQGSAPPPPFSPAMDRAACGADPTPPDPPGSGLGCEFYPPCLRKGVR